MIDFDLLGFLGAGSVGRVYLVRRRDESGRLFALKAVPKTGRKEIESAKEERDILMQLKHPFIVSLHYSFEDGEHMYMAMSYAGNGDVLGHLENIEGQGGELGEPRGRVIFAEVVSALSYLHNRKIIYRDLKPENILVGQDGHIMLADFGISKRLRNKTLTATGGGGGGGGGSGSPNGGRRYGDSSFSSSSRLDIAESVMLSPLSASRAGGGGAPGGGGGGGGAGGGLAMVELTTTRTLVGTPEYMAPEVCQQKAYGYSADWWAAGVVLHELLLGRTPFAGGTVPELMKVLRSPSLRVTLEDNAEDLSLTARDLIEGLLLVDPSKRLGAPQVKAHPFFEGLDWALVYQKEKQTVPAPFPLRPMEEQHQGLQAIEHPNLLADLPPVAEA